MVLGGVLEDDVVLVNWDCVVQSEKTEELSDGRGEDAGGGVTVILVVCF